MISDQMNVRARVLTVREEGHILGMEGRSLWCWIEIRDIGMNSSLSRLLYGGVYNEERALVVSIAKILFSRMISSAKEGRDDSGIGAKEV